MSSKRAYWSIPICESQESLVQIPIQDFAAAPSHEYQMLGAPYHDTSPYALRESVLEALYQAQFYLQSYCQHWRLYIFDAYRPLAVQRFMANHAYQSLIQERDLDEVRLTNREREGLWQEVYTIWAPPNENPLTPPPHSTGAAVDLTILDTQTQACVEMGSPIDELSVRSQPDYFARLIEAGQAEPEDLTYVKLVSKNRLILAEAMVQAGFQRHPGEWWHFCLGDQMWVWLSQQQNQDCQQARYGRYDLLGQGMV